MYHLEKDRETIRVANTSITGSAPDLSRAEVPGAEQGEGPAV